MPQCKALKSFHSEKYGMIRAGSRFSSEPGYALELKSKGLVEVLPDPLEPERRQAHAGAPQNKGSVDPLAAGETKPFVSSRVDQASPRATAPPSKPQSAKR